MRRLRPLLYVILPALSFVAGTTSGASQDVAPKGSDVPVANVHPLKAFRLHGHIDPTLSIEVSTQYLSSVEKCRRAPNIFGAIEGAFGPLSVWVHSDLHRTGNEYDAMVIIDRYVEGRCRWYPYAVGFFIKTSDGVTTGQFETDGHGTRHIDRAVPVIWVNTPGKGDRLSIDLAIKGAKSLPALEIGCREVAESGVKGLLCDRQRPSMTAVITEDATDVDVSFRDDQTLKR